MNIFDQLGDRKSAMVQNALQKSCEVCRAKAGEDCSNTIVSGYPLENRLVHFARATA